MRVILFRGGERGELVALPGEQPVGELAELLEGETEMVPINRRLALVSRRDGEEDQLPIRYRLKRMGREPEPIAGDCAVVAVSQEGYIRDAVHKDLQAAAACIGAVG